MRAEEAQGKTKLKHVKFQVRRRPSYWGSERDGYTKYEANLFVERDIDLVMKHFLGGRMTALADPLGGNGPSWKRCDTQKTSTELYQVATT